ncbi:MAG TPA: hypothetical protein VKT32_02760 [Chthonomonadaceae bacterium]|nr:hypothetical protein [Chthonomonadaceae bacterium]
MQKTVPTPVVVAVIVVVVLVVGVFLYKGMTGGTVGDGHAGRILAAPPGAGPPAGWKGVHPLPSNGQFGSGGR